MASSKIVSTTSQKIVLETIVKDKGAQRDGQLLIKSTQHASFRDQ